MNRMRPAFSRVVAAAALAAALAVAALGQEPRPVTVGAAALADPEGIELTYAWRFRTGDNAQWADAALDDTGWLTLDPALPPDKLPRDTWRGVGWFRRHLRVEPAVLGVPLAIRFQAAGAGEIYLDGELVGRAGNVIVGAPAKLPPVTHGPWPVAMRTRPDHVLAVRYACAAPPPSRPAGPGIGFTLTLAAVGAPAATQREIAILNPVVGVLVGVALLHLAFFSFYPRLRENLEDARSPIAWAWMAAPLLAVFAVHLAVLGRYGIGWDELYYVACADHLDWGYVDHPPLIAVVTAVTRFLLGDSLPALRFPCLLAGLLSAFVTGLIAREFGAGRFGQFLATTCVALAPASLVIDHLLSMNAFDHLFWALAILIVVRILGRNERHLWPLFGGVVGIGLLNKYSIGFFCLALGLGLLITPARRQLADRRFWLGVGIGGVLFVPHVVWELHQGWPSLEFMHNVMAHKNLPLSPWAFFQVSADQMNVLALPVWALGLGYLLFSRSGRRFRALAWIYPALLVFFQVTHGKPYYLAPAYLVLLAAGAFVFERGTADRSWLRAPSTALIILPVLLRSPMLLPLLKEPQLVAYQNWLGVQTRVDERGAAPTKLPIYFATMHGFEDLVQVVARIYHSLPASERARTAIYASGYGYAGAVDYFGPRYGLPKAISGHNSYWLWGPRDYTGEIVIVVDANRLGLEEVFASVEPAEAVDSPYAQREATVYLCRGLKQPLRTFWPQVRTYQ